MQLEILKIMFNILKTKYVLVTTSNTNLISELKKN